MKHWGKQEKVIAANQQTSTGFLSPEFLEAHRSINSAEPHENNDSFLGGLCVTRAIIELFR